MPAIVDCIDAAYDRYQGVIADLPPVSQGIDQDIAENDVWVIETDDGAIIYVTYGGRAEWSGGPGSNPIYIAPRFETGDERYAWLNDVVAVAEGRLLSGGVEYRVFEACND